MSGTTMRIVIADDHALVRAGLSKLLESMPGVTVVAQVAHGPAALEAAVQLQPDVVLLDLSMPGGSGLAAAQQIAAQCPAVRVLVLSMHQEAQYVKQALKVGAAGYLVKDSAPTELELALRAVERGETYLSPAVSKGVVSGYIDKLSNEEAAANHLTPRQTEILLLIAKGQSTKEIARHLDLSVKTVETHRSQLMKHIDVHEVAGLVRYALRSGLLSLDD